jgi:hypothetical protein
MHTMVRARVRLAHLADGARAAVCDAMLRSAADGRCAEID